MDKYQKQSIEILKETIKNVNQTIKSLKKDNLTQNDLTNKLTKIYLNIGSIYWRIVLND